MNILQNKKHLNAIPYFGGKTVHLTWLYRYFPSPKIVSHFVDGMCGSMSVSLNANYSLITANDINDDIINFFTVLRDNYDQLLHLIKYTPFSRAEFNLSGQPTSDRIEAARRLFVRACQGFGGVSSQNKHSGWGFQLNPGAKESHFRVDTWNTKLSILDQVVSKLRAIQIESLPVLSLIDKYNSPQIFIYLDPPYKKETRGLKSRYKHEFDDENHIELAQKCKDSNSLIAVSGYDCEHYNELYPNTKWTKIVGPENTKSAKKAKRREVLWLNYDYQKLNPQYNLFT